MERKMGSHSLVGRRGQGSISEGTALLQGCGFLCMWPREPTTHSLSRCEHLLCATSLLAGSESQNGPSSVQRPPASQRPWKTEPVGTIPCPSFRLTEMRPCPELLPIF